MCLFSELITELILMSFGSEAEAHGVVSLCAFCTELCLGALRCWCVTELCLSSFFARSCVFRPAAPKYTELCLVQEHEVVSSRRQKHGVVSYSGARSCVSRMYTKIAIPVSGLQTLEVQCVAVTADWISSVRASCVRVCLLLVQ